LKTILYIKFITTIMTTINGININDIIENLHKSVEILQKNSLEHKNERGYTKFHSACHEWDIEFVQCSINHYNINTTDNNGQTPLITCSRFGHTNIVRLLLDNNANIDIIDKHGLNALDYAQINKKVDIINMFILNNNMIVNNASCKPYKICDICEFLTNNQLECCNHIMCNNCFKNMRSTKCPFCRIEIPSLNTPTILERQIHDKKHYDLESTLETIHIIQTQLNEQNVQNEEQNENNNVQNENNNVQNEELNDNNDEFDETIHVPNDDDNVQNEEQNDNNNVQNENNNVQNEEQNENNNVQNEEQNDNNNVQNENNNVQNEELNDNNDEFDETIHVPNDDDRFDADDLNNDQIVDQIIDQIIETK